MNELQETRALGRGGKSWQQESRLPSCCRKLKGSSCPGNCRQAILSDTVKCTHSNSWRQCGFFSVRNAQPLDFFFFFSICISSFSIQQFLSYILEVLIFNVTVPFIGKISGLSIFVPCGGLWPRIGAYEVPNERKHLVIHEHLVGDYFSILDPVSQPVWPGNVGRASFSEVRTEGIPAWRLGRSLRGRDTSGEPVSRGLAICDSAFLFCTLAYREARHVEISVLQWIFFLILKLKFSWFTVSCFRCTTQQFSYRLLQNTE